MCLAGVFVMACDTSREVISQEHLGLLIAAWAFHCQNEGTWNNTDPSYVEI